MQLRLGGLHFGEKCFDVVVFDWDVDEPISCQPDLSKISTECCSLTSQTAKVAGTCGRFVKRAILVSVRLSSSPEDWCACAWYRSQIAVVATWSELVEMRRKLADRERMETMRNRRRMSKAAKAMEIVPLTREEKNATIDWNDNTKEDKRMGGKLFRSASTVTVACCVGFSIVATRAAVPTIGASSGFSAHRRPMLCCRRHLKPTSTSLWAKMQRCLAWGLAVIPVRSS